MQKHNFPICDAGEGRGSLGWRTQEDFALLRTLAEGGNKQVRLC